MPAQLKRRKVPRRRWRGRIGRAAEGVKGSGIRGESARAIIAKWWVSRTRPTLQFSLPRRVGRVRETHHLGLLPLGRIEPWRGIDASPIQLIFAHFNKSPKRRIRPIANR